MAITSTTLFLNDWANYNNGGLGYGWMTPQEVRDFMEERKDEDREWFIADIDNYLGIDFGNLDYANIEDICNTIETLEDMDQWELDTILAACELWNVDEVLENGVGSYNLLCDVNTDSDLGYYWIEESGCYDLSKMGNLANYIDYEAFGRDVALESNGGFTSYGFIEYVG